MNCLNVIISLETMYDKANPRIIICSDELAEALGVKTLLFMDLVGVVKPHLTSAEKDKENISPNISCDWRSSTRNQTSVTALWGTTPTWVDRICRNTQLMDPDFDTTGFFCVHPRYLKFPHYMGLKGHFVFNYLTIINAAVLYVHLLEDVLPNDYNHIYLIERSPLGEALKVRAVIHWQIKYLVRAQCIPITFHTKESLMKSSQ